MSNWGRRGSLRFVRSLVVIVWAMASATLATAATAATAFTHPGVMHSREDLDRMRANVSVEPYKTAFRAFSSTGYASYQNKGQGPFSYETYAHGQFEIRNDAQVVHYNAVMWYVTGNVAYRDNAIKIMMAWANTLTAFDVTDHITAGTAVFDFANGAEIIRASSGGAWSSADIAKFQNWLLTYLYPALLTPGNSIAASHLEAAGHGGLQMKGLISLGVFCDRRDIYDFAVASFLHNGSYTYGLKEYVDVSGQNYETARDEGHASGNIGSFSQIAYVAWNQGQDLFAAYNNLLMTATESQAKIDMLYDVVPVWWTAADGSYHNVISPSSRQPGDNLEPDLAYHIYHDKKNLKMPFTQLMASLRFPNAAQVGDSFLYRADSSGVVPTPPLRYGDVVPAAAELFGDYGYSGVYLARLGPGQYNLASLRAAGASGWTASSIKLPAGWSATLYDHDNYIGSSVTLTGATNFFNQGGLNFNDRTVSMTVSSSGGVQGGPVLLYTGKNYTGAVASVPAGAYHTAQLIALGIPNDGLMSVHVPPGYVVYLIGGDAPSNLYYNERLIGDAPDVSGDSVSSILVVASH